MPRLRLILLFALAFVALELFTAAPAAAQLRRTGTNGGVWSQPSSGRSGRSNDDRYDRSRQSNDEDWNDDHDDHDDHNGDDDRGQRGRRTNSRGNNAQQQGNWCKDANHDGRCDYSQSSRYPGSQVQLPTRRPLPFTELLSALVRQP